MNWPELLVVSVAWVAALVGCRRLVTVAMATNEQTAKRTMAFDPILLAEAWSSLWEAAFRRLRWYDRLAGCLYACLVIGSLVGLWSVIRLLLTHRWFILATAWDTAIAALLIGGGKRLPWGRSTVAEPTLARVIPDWIDGFVTPLLALALAGLPGIIVARTVVILDATVNPDTHPPTAFAWAARRVATLIRWLPARCARMLLVAAGAYRSSPPTDGPADPLLKGLRLLTTATVLLGLLALSFATVRLSIAKTLAGWAWIGSR